MKKQFLLGCVVILLATACTHREKAATATNVIDIAGNLDQTVKFNASDFGKSIRYVPLETHDDCLIGNNPKIKVLKDYIVVTVDKSCYLFNKKDGSFIEKIGHVGDDPEGYSDPFCWPDEKEDLLYFSRSPSQLIKYDMKGNYAGKMELTTPPGLASHFLITGSQIVGYYNELFKTDQTAVAFFDTEGQLLDTIPSILTPTKLSMNDIENVSVLKRSNEYGNWAINGLLFVNYKDNQALVAALSAVTLWKYDDQIRFKEIFVDTIFNLKGRTREPYKIFNTGSWHWPEQERTDKENSHKRILPTYVAENDRIIFFQCIQGIYKEPVLYNGIYDKETGKTTLSKSKDTISDDLTHFMPFEPLTIGTTGEFAGLIQAADALEWLEEHPETETGGKLAFLKELTDDMNPVVVLVE